MIIQDPIHTEIVITDDDILDLIQTSAFQRLQGMKQQGNTFFVLPSAIHNRYSHSLGVYENMRRMIHRLSGKGRLALTEEEVKIALITALLHDIGHGPFSHCFETITDIHHERWTQTSKKPVRARRASIRSGVAYTLARRGPMACGKLPSIRR